MTDKSNSETQQRLFNQGTAYLSTTGPRVFTTACILNCSVSVGYLPHKRTPFNNETGVGKRTILYSLYSMTKKNYAAKIPLKTTFEDLFLKADLSQMLYLFL